ncbi:MAG: hypothetical protein H0X69_13220 [Gemmatimonadales bacterium]|nr:hypothetical protein [Gemmatimonadales bacterium]
MLHTDNAPVASVIPDGYVMGGRSGLATIHVTSGERQRDIPVTVTP